MGGRSARFGMVFPSRARVVHHHGLTHEILRPPRKCMSGFTNIPEMAKSMSRGIWITLIGFGLVACERPDEPLDAFSQRWQDASQNDAQQLYHMLDSTSQRKIRRDLEVMRGLDAASQRTVLDQLGDRTLRDLTKLSPQRYFAMLWQKVTNGQSTHPRLEPQGPDSGVMTLSLGSGQDARQLHVLVMRQAGQWTWQLPQQGIATRGDPTPTSLTENAPATINPYLPPTRNYGVPPQASW